MHLTHDAKMLPICMSNPFLKTHFAGAGQNLAGASLKQQFIGGVPVAAPCSFLASSSFAAGTTEPWYESNGPLSRPKGYNIRHNFKLFFDL